MVAIATVQQYFNQYINGETDEATEIVSNLVLMPAGHRLYQRSGTSRQWNWRQSPAYSGYLVIEIVAAWATNKDCIRLSWMGGWRTYADGLDQLTSEVNLEGFRTSKEALEAVCQKFIQRFQKPSSQGNVQVFYDESKGIWCWKRPSSDKFLRDENGDAYHVETCLSVYSISGGGLVPDEFRFLSEDDRAHINNGTHPDIAVVSGQYCLKPSLTPLYLNQLPFNTIYSYVTNDSLSRYEFVMVDGERRYINLARTVNALLNYPIHSYTTRIESLVPADKLFLMGKCDLYSRRDKDEVPFLGWELEAASNLSTVGKEKTAAEFKAHMPWLVMCKNDGSISPEGFETVSVPATLDFWQESNLSSALDSMRVAPYNMRSFEHSKCGFHVHVSRSALSVLDLQKLERFVHNPDNNDFITKIAGRGSGQYQNYNKDLFDNRKKWTSKTKKAFASPFGTTRVVEEGIKYFHTSMEAILDAAMRTRPENVETPGARLYKLMDFIGEWVSYEHLDLIIRTDHMLLVDRYAGFHGYGMSDWFNDLQRSDGPRWLTEITGSSDQNDHTTFFKALFEEILCFQRPKFSKIVSIFFPEWNLEVLADEATPAAVDWRAGLLKSKAPFKRSLSKNASTIVKGPVGKGVGQRYDALNTTNANTVEFRMFKGTMNGTTIMRYLEFTDALVRFVAATNATNEGLHYSAFVGWLKNDSFNVARYEHLVSFIIENKFLDRKEIRRKTLPTVVGDDKYVEGLAAVLAKGFGDLDNPVPLGTFITEPTVATVEPAMTPAQAEEIVYGGEYDEDDEPDYPITQSAECSDPDCSICNPTRDL